MAWTTSLVQAETFARYNKAALFSARGHVYAAEVAPSGVLARFAHQSTVLVDPDELQDVRAN